MVDGPCYLKASNPLTRKCLLKNSQVSTQNSRFFISFFITIVIGQRVSVSSPKQSEICSSFQSVFKCSDLSQSVRIHIPIHNRIHLSCTFSALKPPGLKWWQGQSWEEGGQASSFLLPCVGNQTEGTFRKSEEANKSYHSPTLRQ